MSDDDARGLRDEGRAQAQYAQFPRAPKGLITKLSEIMAETERVAKRGRNDFHRYDYATEADIAAAVREHMAKRHLLMVPDVEQVTWREGKGKEGREGGSPIATLNIRFTVYDGDTGETLSFHITGEGQDAGDKATYKAMTGANKYALMKMFQIPTGDDPERDEGKTRSERRRAASAESGPYAERERERTQSAPSSAPSSEPAPTPTLSGWVALQERMQAWPPEIAAIIPPDEALYLMPEAEAEQNRAFYVDGIRGTAKRRKLNSKETGDLRELFLGSRTAHLDAANIYVLRALWRYMEPDRE